MVTMTQPLRGGGNVLPRNLPSTHDAISLEPTVSLLIDALQTDPVEPTCTLTFIVPETSVLIGSTHALRNHHA